MLNLNLEKVPSSCGVYLFKGEKGEILYVGKAKNLKNRLSFYLKNSSLSSKVHHLVQITKEVEFFLTHNEKEALLLEANLIKRYRPKYNVLLKDDKNYPILKIALDEEYPALKIVRKRKKGEKALYFGPFTSARGLREILKILSTMFPLRKCSLSEMKKRKNPCIYYQIKRCLAPCVNSVSKEEYEKLVRGVVEFFQGKGKELLEKLKEEMHRLAENLEFEKAAFIRDRIKDLEKLLENQAVVLRKPLDLDLWETKREKDKDYFIVLFVRYGYLYGFQTLESKNWLEESSLKEIILQFYTEGRIIPEKILVPEIWEDKEEWEKLFSEISGQKVEILPFSTQEELVLLHEIALKNLESYLNSIKKKSTSSYEVISQDLRELFKLSREPRFIEAIDLSQFYGEAKVGAVVCFFEGTPLKERYRRYHIRSSAKDDYTMLYEILERRLRRGLEENTLPDLILIDGGKGHLETALRVAEDLGIKEVEIRAIAKNEKREPEKIYLPGRKNPLFLSRYQEVYHFIGNIMEEAHRFAKSFAEKTKNAHTLSSALEKVKGIGPKRKEIILKHFRDLEELTSASLEELSKLPSFNLKIAKVLKENLKNILKI